MGATSCGAHVATPRVVGAVAVAGATIAVVATLRGPEPPPTAFGSLLAVAAPTVAGRLVARQRAQAARLEELADNLRHERARAEHAAVEQERSRIARELHDVVGHNVSVIALQADAAAASLEKAPALARAPIDAIRESAGDALDEMRRVLGALHEEGSEAELRPQPGLADVGALADRMRTAGTPVELAVRGEPRSPPPSVELAAYRLDETPGWDLRRRLPTRRRHPRHARGLIRSGGEQAAASPSSRPRLVRRRLDSLRRPGDDESSPRPRSTRPSTGSPKELRESKSGSSSGLR